MQPTSEKCSYLEELGCKEKSLTENRFCFNQNQDTEGQHYFCNILLTNLGSILHNRKQYRFSRRSFNNVLVDTDKINL